MANKNANRVPMADTLVWARVMRPRVPIIYIDMNHFIGMARANTGDVKTPRGYRELFDAARKATQQGRALVPLSTQHLFEISAINDPRQRKDIANVMEELSGFQYLLGRSDWNSSHGSSGTSRPPSTRGQVVENPNEMSSQPRFES
ncbi:hypothetical protein [Nocardiopsis quinghaiensis]|uniref:hypothetical protein n=1 Tax=Nocardiopsis quinghaiensis TaxID=464995 RepID=UPI00123A433C|nr:hypothetical protein [Nocardiopsis quinghaiensis]